MTIASIEKNRMAHIKQFISEIPLFSKYVNKIYFKCEVETFIYKQVILKKGQIQNWVYFVLEGDFQEISHQNMIFEEQPRTWKEILVKLKNEKWGELHM